MFNDPFESFHDVVAQAKEERNQLDRLLTISTPRERSLVAAGALAMLAFAAWLFFGGIARSVTLDGIAVESAANPAGGEAVRAMVWLDRDVARQIEAGMQASVEFARSAADVPRLDGVVSSLDAAAVAGLPDSRQFEAPAAMHNVTVSLGGNPGPAGLDGAECRIVIQLGSVRPISLLGIGRS